MISCLKGINAPNHIYIYWQSPILTMFFSLKTLLSRIVFMLSPIAFIIKHLSKYLCFLEPKSRFLAESRADSFQNLQRTPNNKLSMNAIIDVWPKSQQGVCIRVSKILPKCQAQRCTTSCSDKDAIKSRAKLW